MTTKAKISFFVHDLGSNPIVRAAPIAMALSRDYEVEILGLILSGRNVYEPYRNLFEYRVLHCQLDLPAILKAISRLAVMATGDVIFACKPLLTSFGPALLASKWFDKRPLFLDIEDDEWIPMGKTWRDFIWKDLIKGWRHATAWKYTIALHPFTHFANGKSVISKKLQRRYSGTIVMNGPDETIFNPADLSDTNTQRKVFGLPLGRCLVLFAGVPRPHKGWSILLEALLKPQCEMWDLVLAGPDNPEFELASSKLGVRCHRLGALMYSQMPALLTAIDAVAVPQRRVTFSESQVPAKAIEAMAMAKPVVASRVGDLPEILGNGIRGWLFEPDDVNELAEAFRCIGVDPIEAARRGEAGRDWFLEEASAEAIRHRLEPMIAFHLQRLIN